MKKLFIFLIILLSLVFVKNIFAQSALTSASSSSEKYHLTFPIAELGNCTSLEACKAYCDISSHQDACVAYAKEKGFYQSTQDASILSAAESELGCDSADSCKALCSKAENYDKCTNFAKEHHFGPTTQNLTSNSTLEKAKEILGCDSINSCRDFCSKSDNYQKCSDFAKEANLKGGQQTVGPGGCTSAESCKEFCANPNNVEVCSQFGKQASSVESQQVPVFKGPGGCTTAQECSDFCRNNPSICRAYEYAISPTSSITISPTQVIPTPMTPEMYCKLYPTHCTTATNTSTPTLTSIPTSTRESRCISYGCSWNGTSCSCPNIPTPTPTPFSTQYPTVDRQAYCQSYGCTWTGIACVCPATPTPIYNPPTPTINIQQYCQKNGCEWINDSCSCVNRVLTPTPVLQVQGVATEASVNWIQLLSKLFIFLK